MTDAAEPAGVVPSSMLDLASLLRKPGNQRTVPIEIVPEGLETTTARVTALRGDLLAEGVGDKLSISGRINVAWMGDCRRCLEPAVGVVPMDLAEFFEPKPVEGETYELPTDEQLDLSPMLAEQALLVLPLAPLCGDDCVGPAPERFPANVEPDPSPDAAGDPAAPGDPRWAALDALTFDTEPAQETPAE